VDRLPQLASELLRLSPRVILAAATANALAVRKLTASTPIVVPALGDGIRTGLIDSEARPGGNVTGITPYVEGLPAKQLELARELLPGVKRIGLLDAPADAKGTEQRKEIEAAGSKAGVSVVTMEVRSPEEIAAVYDAMAAKSVQIVIVEQTNLFLAAGKRIAEAAATRKLPTVYGYRQHVDAGGLISYGIDLTWCFHRAALYVDKILKGAKPADLPVELPTNIQLVINAKAATALKLAIPRSLLSRADEVIE